MLSAAEQDHWLRIARKYTRAGIDAADVLQEACLAAMRARRTDLSTPQNQRYFRGILRKTAWAMMRADTRRRRHERSHPAGSDVAPSPEGGRAPDLSGLPTSLQAIANLILANLNRDEIRSALGISDEALRRRLADLRRYIETHSFTFESFEAAVQASARLAPEDVGLIRRSLLEWVGRSGNAIGTVDPDGHLIAATGKISNPAHKSDSAGN